MTLAAPLYSVDDFAARARAALLPVPPPFEGDHLRRRDFETMPELTALALAQPPVRAAVLVPVVDLHEGAQVLLTTRTAHLSRHAGQIAFPGGRIDPEDDGPLGAALREAHEEIGLSAALVTPLGYLDIMLTTTGFRIAPVVALVEPSFVPAPNPAEVHDVFETPLSFLMRRENHAEHVREIRGQVRRTLAMPFGERYIWGVTAEILRNLYERLYRE